MFKRMKLSYKMMGGFILVAMIALAIGVVGFIGLNHTMESLNEMATDHLPSVQAILSIYQKQTSVLLGERSILLAKTKDEVVFQKGRLEGYWNDIEKNWAIFKPLAEADPALADLWSEFQQVWQEWKVSHQKVVELATQRDPESLRQATQLSYGAVRENYIKSETLLNKIIEYMKTHNSEEAQKAQAEEKIIESVTVISIIIGVLLALTIGYFLTRAITQPVNQIIRSLSESSQQVTAASEELSAASQQLAEGNNEQASSIEETSSTLEESASMIRQNTEHTQQAAVLAGQVKGAADKGNEEMQQMMSSMGELKKSSDQIAKIIKVIDEIAFQTNILALNAAVEAARAGDAGMGFAVVAEEVRNLAQRSAQAAKDTAFIIEHNIELSENGVNVAQRVATALEEIKDQAKKVNELMAEIAGASQEQSQGIQQINSAIAQMEKVTQQSAATAEESAAAAEELSAQAETMMEVVQQLADLVEGVSDQRGQQPVIARRPLTTARKQLSMPRTNRQLTTGELGKRTAVINPEDVIPLEDDLRDF